VRVILDSNVWLAVLTTNGFCRRMWKKARHDSVICASPDILEEIEGKLRSKFGFNSRHARLLTLFVERQTHAVKVVSAIRACRDPDDDRILAAAFDGECSHLITGDADLLALKKFEGIAIVTPREFMELASHV
jgi:putative PIN family toxin of toxin-antitoxin system